MSDLLDLREDPFTLFARWYGEAGKAEPDDPNAMALATVGNDGMPSVRIVLLKDYGPQGFTFHTNYESRKGDQLKARPKAALCLYWKSLHRQIRIEGETARVPAAESDTYFAMRPRESQIAAWASLQSQALPDRADFETRITEYEKQYPGKVPRPPHWGGYRLTPSRIEFWQQRPFRRHDRMVYVRQGDGSWTATRLYP